jgi:hypothetical protein
MIQPFRTFATFALTAATLGSVAQASWYDLSAGGAGFKLLKLDAAPTALALSGSGVGAPGTDLARNPATDSVELVVLSTGYGATYSRLDGSLQQAAWTVPSGAWTFSALARFEGFSDIPGRDESDRPTGTYSASSWAFDAGLSGPTGIDGLRAGASLGAGMDAVADADAWAGWLGLGLVYRPAGTNWSLGASARNLGVGTTSGLHSEKLPATFQVGGVWNQKLSNWTFTPTADAKFVADEDLQFPIGFEAKWNVLSLRTGYVVGRDEARPSFGLGLDWEGWIVEVSTGWHQALGFAPGARIGIKI